jgi:23S rRNA (adenine2503-C2)-methyltransferase
MYHDNMNKKNLAGLTANEISGLIGPLGFDHSHAISVATAIYRNRVTDISMIRKIPKKLRDHLAYTGSSLIHKPVKSEYSSDGSIKYLFKNSVGQLYETVYIPEKKRTTLCVSVQSGCRMGCPFCVTAGYGFHGDLDSSDIVNQVLAIPETRELTHIVFMGMGEPLDNIDNVLKACDIFTAEWGMAISPRNITVSTVGITPGVTRLLENSRCNLTLSLFSPFPEERIEVIPAEKRYPALEIIGIMKDFPATKKRRLSIAYVMIGGRNDTDKHLDGLISLLRNSGIRVNLLPYHTVAGDKIIPSTIERMMYFKHNLVISGVPASVRKSRGEDISAACGQLAAGLNPGMIIK